MKSLEATPPHPKNNPSPKVLSLTHIPIYKHDFDEWRINDLVSFSMLNDAKYNRRQVYEITSAIVVWTLRTEISTFFLKDACKKCLVEGYVTFLRRKIWGGKFANLLKK